jgi:hypothetical protein
MTHETIRFPANRPRIPLLHILLFTLSLSESIKVHVDDNMPFAVLTLIFGVTREGAEQDEFEGSRIRHSCEQSRANFDTEIESFPGSLMH